MISPASRIDKPERDHDVTGIRLFATGPRGREGEGGGEGEEVEEEEGGVVRRFVYLGYEFLPEV